MRKSEIKKALKQLDTVPLPDKEKILSECDGTSLSHDVSTNLYHRKLRLKPLIAALAVIVIIVSGFSVYAIAAEIKEYKEAVTFFNEYDLSTKGLSRGEIKNVYRDISTGSFTYHKTAGVIERSINKSSIPGYEIFQEDPTPEDLENFWNYMNYNGRFNMQSSANEKGVSYKKYYAEENSDNSYFEKYKDGKLVWKVKFNKWLDNYVEYEGKVFVYGESPILSNSQTQYAWMAVIDHDGNILWETKLQNGFSSEYIGAILPSEDKIAVFSRGELKYLCLNEYDYNGNVLSFHKNEIGNYGIWNAARLGEGYVVHLGSYRTNEYTRIVKVSSNGTITDSFSYESNDNYYYITDMIEYNGYTYLSAYAVPILDDEGQSLGGRFDIAAVLNYISDNQLYSISNEELTKLVRDNYTAVLLVCDSSSGIPQTFFSVKGSLGGKLALSDKGNLIWDVESISDTHYSLCTSSFTIAGVSHIYRYTFNSDGTILSQEKTGEYVDFRR